jgi:hypothetical protein
MKYLNCSIDSSPPPSFDDDEEEEEEEEEEEDFLSGYSILQWHRCDGHVSALGTPND